MTPEITMATLDNEYLGNLAELVLHSWPSKSLGTEGTVAILIIQKQDCNHRQNYHECRRLIVLIV